MKAIYQVLTRSDERRWDKSFGSLSKSEGRKIRNLRTRTIINCQFKDDTFKGIIESYLSSANEIGRKKMG